MAVRAHFESSCEVGVFARLTNSYCLCALGGPESFYSVFESELGEQVPVIQCTVGGTRIVGRVSVGNRHGLLLPSIATHQEVRHLRETLPEGVEVQRVAERLSALGNCVVANDYVALVHPELDRETEEAIADALQVEVFRAVVGGNSLVGSYCALTNRGGLVHPGTSLQDMEELSGLIQLPLATGTVNRGSGAVGAGLVASDWAAFCGMGTTAVELGVVEQTFNLQQAGQGMRSALMETVW